MDWEFAGSPAGGRLAHDADGFARLAAGKCKFSPQPRQPIQLSGPLRLDLGNVRRRRAISRTRENGGDAQPCFDTGRGGKRGAAFGTRFSDAALLDQNLGELAAFANARFGGEAGTQVEGDTVTQHTFGGSDISRVE